LKPRKPAKHRVTERAVLARINRALKKSGEVVRKSRRADAPDDYFKVLKGGSLVQYVDLKELAEELKVLNAWEVLEK
jgi:tRNA G46 methylase TrmB